MNLSSARKEAHLTQKQVAERLGVSQSAVALWEAGKTLPRRKRLNQVAEIYGTTVLELLATATDIDGTNREKGGENDWG